jgi:hypothetical protein
MFKSTIDNEPIERGYTTMLRHTGGQRVGSGTYWDVMNGARVDFDQEGTLPGGNGATYLKASSGAILLLGPIIGLAYVVVLPILGIVTALSLMMQRTVGGLFSLGKYLFSFGWRPSEAFLSGKNKKQDDSEKTGKSPTDRK